MNRNGSPEQAPPSRLQRSWRQALVMLKMILPMLLAVIGLVGLFETLVTPEMLRTLFHGDALTDTLVGTAAGGVAIGQPFLSYIIGGELLQEGISRYAVTAFILSFVTLGVVQLPFEAQMFGMRFTVVRNLLAVAAAVVIAVLTVATLQVFS